MGSGSWRHACCFSSVPGSARHSPISPRGPAPSLQSPTPPCGVRSPSVSLFPSSDPVFLVPEFPDTCLTQCTLGKETCRGSQLKHHTRSAISKRDFLKGPFGQVWHFIGLGLRRESFCQDGGSGLLEIAATLSLQAVSPWAGYLSQLSHNISTLQALCKRK